jgi:hypothetical protein
MRDDLEESFGTIDGSKSVGSESIQKKEKGQAHVFMEDVNKYGHQEPKSGLLRKYKPKRGTSNIFRLGRSAMKKTDREGMNRSFIELDKSRQETDSNINSV